MTGDRDREAGIRADRAVFMISIAAELAGMHPQTLRIYEDRGLINPQRSPKGTRLYSQSDVDRLRRIQEMTAELGMNLAGVEKVFELEADLERMQGRVRMLESRVEQLRSAMLEEAKQMEAEIEQAKRVLRAEIVPYRPGTLVRIRKS